MLQRGGCISWDYGQGVCWMMRVVREVSQQLHSWDWAPHLACTTTGAPKLLQEEPTILKEGFANLNDQSPLGLYGSSSSVGMLFTMSFATLPTRISRSPITRKNLMRLLQDLEVLPKLQ